MVNAIRFGNTKRRLILRLLIAGFCILLLRTFASVAYAQSSAETNESKLAATEKTECTANLKRIYAAIVKYQADHKELPNWLSDLVPQYIDDVNILTCPVCRRTGSAETSALADPKIPTSYYYEFNPALLGDDAFGEPRTHHEWKARQMALVGPIVPLLSCPHHTSTLNLAYDGRVYETRGSWELAVTNLSDIADLSAARIFPGNGKMLGAQKSAAAFKFINLTPYYNAALTNSWLGRPNDNLAYLPSGAQNFGGVEYDVRGIIQLAGNGEATKRFPRLVKGIEVNQKCARLHFLHAAAVGDSVAEGTQVGSYVVHFAANVVPLEIPIYYGQDLRDWHIVPGEKAKESNVVWTGTNAASASVHRPIRLFATTWENVTPGVEIRSIDFISSQSPTAPFLIAITAE